MEESENLNSPSSVLTATPSPHTVNVTKEVHDGSLPQSSTSQSETQILRSEEEKLQNSPNENDLEVKPVNFHNNHRRYQTNNDTIQVTQSRSIFSHEDCFVYGNPKEIIRTIEPLPCEVIPDMRSLDHSSNVLDLSCKPASKTENESTNQETYQNYKRTLNKNFSHQLHNQNFATGSNMDISLVSRKPSIPEQLQIAKIQRQQRKAAQQQQKMLQQMRRNLETAGKSTTDPNRTTLLPPNAEASQINQKNVKIHHAGHENDSGLENNSRKKDDRLPFPTNSYFTTPQYTYYDPVPSKELPDGHPILPLFDPVYFSALYNAHGYLPPSSPSIAAAFISTLHEVLPKLPSMFTPQASNNNISPQKTHDQN